MKLPAAQSISYRDSASPRHHLGSLDSGHVFALNPRRRIHNRGYRWLVALLPNSIAIRTAHENVRHQHESEPARPIVKVTLHAAGIGRQ
jgi:hypothetical protein